MLSLSQIKHIGNILDTGYAFSAFKKTLNRLEDTISLNAVVSCMDLNTLDDYNSIIDYVFCETWSNPWKRRCRDFYEGKEPLLIRAKDFSPGERLWYDIAMSRLIIPICVKLQNEIGPYKWRRVVNNMRSYLIGKEVIINSRPNFKKYKQNSTKEGQ